MSIVVLPVFVAVPVAVVSALCELLLESASTGPMAPPRAESQGLDPQVAPPAFQQEELEGPVVPGQHQLDPQVAPVTAQLPWTSFCSPVWLAHSDFAY